MKPQKNAHLSKPSAFDNIDSSASPIDSVDTPPTRVFNRRSSLLDEHDMERARERALKDAERQRESEERRKKRQLEREARRKSIQPASTSVFSMGPTEEEKKRHLEEEHQQFMQKLRPYSPSKPVKDPAAETERKRQEAIRKLREAQQQEEEEEERKRKMEEEEKEKKKMEEEKSREAERAKQALKIIMEDEETNQEEEEVAEAAQKPMFNRRGSITELLSESYAIRPVRQSFMPKVTANARNSIFEYAQYGDYKKIDAQQEEKQDEDIEHKMDEYAKEQKRVGALPVESLKIYPYSVLIQPNPPFDVDARRKEYHLSEEEFQSVFKMTRSKYESLPNWKRIQLRKQTGLF